MDPLSLIANLIAATFRVATPILLAATGETYSERSGVLNLGIEGTMFFGALVGFYVADKSGSLWLGLVVAILAGMLAGLLMAVLTVTLGVNQHVSGLSITLLLTGLSLYIFRLNYGNLPVPPKVEVFKPVTIFKDIPFLGVISEQVLLTYITFFIVVPLAWFVLYRTNFGLKIRSVGENPEAADAAGINVYVIRYAALIIGGMLMAAGGAVLSLAIAGSFTDQIISGRGWVALAIVIFGNWNPVQAMWGALIFGGTNALQLMLQAMGLQLPIPYETFLALPYIVTIIALVFAGRSDSCPAALLKPYRRE
jgi:general nucleoside transport system permease protein